jgi:hypothetical protein
MTKRLIYSFTLILLGTVCVSAGQPVTARIPFPFHVGDSMLPAGSYTTDTNAAPGILRLRSGDCKSTVMILSSAVQASNAAAQAKLVFTRYGDEYFLYQVWPGGSDTGRQLRKSRRETEIAAARHRAVQTVLASK